MARSHCLARMLIAPLPFGAMVLSGAALGEPPSLQAQLVGAWNYVSVDTVRPDGSRSPMYGTTPHGIAIFDSKGHYALVTIRSDLPRFASGNRMDGTPDEYKAIAQGSISHFGRYTINETDKTITFYIETSTFPNWNGVEQKRPLSIDGDELKWVTPVASSGGSAEVVLKRAK